jgi:hypothetical protein
MNCKDFESMIHELVSQRLADKTKQLKALEHAGHCLCCALRLDEETKLTDRLQAFAITLQGQRAPVRVEEELLQAFRETTLRSDTPLLRIAGKRVWRGLSWGLAVAATVAIAWTVMFLWPHLHPGSSKVSSRTANHQPPAPSEVSRNNLATGQVGRRAALNGPATPQVARSGSLERAALDQSASEFATDFISLGTCDDSQCMEEATLVRVALPAEALLAFGVEPGNDYSPEGSVQADVAVGSNGVPFAIRFVNYGGGNNEN